MRVPLRAPALALLVGACLLAPRSAAAHPHGAPPPVSLDFSMRASRVEAELMIDTALAEEWIGDAWDPPADPKDPQAVGPLTKALLARITLTVDGEPLTLRGESVVTLLSFEMNGGREAQKLRLRLATPVKSPAQRMHLVWTDFSGILWEQKQELPAMVEAERVYDSAILTPEEPIFDWRRRPPEFDWSKPIAGVRAPPPPRWSLPGPAIALGLLGLLALAGLGTRRMALRRRLVLAASCFLFAGLLSPLHLGRIETAPLWGGQSVLPSSEQAERIFSTLHENIYRAFANPGKPETERERELRIYGELATSVTPDLIDKLYVEILESLVLREQNGVICQVDDIEKLDGKVEFPKEAWAQHFFVDWHWSVLGTITHMGHTHRRKNVYRARYLVRHDGGSWRIASIEVLEHRRIDENKQGQLVVEQVLTKREAAADAGLRAGGSDDGSAGK